MFKIVFWSTPVLFGCIVPSSEASAISAHVKLTSGRIEYVSDDIADYSQAESLYEELCKPLNSGDLLE